MLARVHGWATALWLALAGGAGLGFVARDLLGLDSPAIALAWVVGVGLGAWSGGSGRPRSAAPYTLRPMSDAALDLCRRAYDLYGRGDLDAMLELFAEDVEVYVAPPNFESGTYVGHDDYRALLERWGASWSMMRIEPVSLTLAGDWVLAKVEYRGRTRESDIEVTQPSWELSLWRDGTCRRYEVYFDPEQGKQAFAELERTAARE